MQYIGSMYTGAITHWLFCDSVILYGKFAAVPSRWTRLFLSVCDNDVDGKGNFFCVWLFSATYRILASQDKTYCESSKHNNRLDGH